VPYGQQTHGKMPRDWMVPAFIVTFLCAWPLGVLAIINASNVSC